MPELCLNLVYIDLKLVGAVVTLRFQGQGT